MLITYKKKMHTDFRIPEQYTQVITKMVDIADKNGYTLYAVGGFVRDLITNENSKDLDILVDGPGDSPAISFVTLLHSNGLNEHEPVLYGRFGVGMLTINGQKVEFVMPRNESYTLGSRKPEVFKSAIKEDAIRRDFTINTLMIHLPSKKLLDPTGKGLTDLRNGVIRAANPEVTKVFTDDPLRMLRAIRFMVTKHMHIEKKTKTAIIRNADKLQAISMERIQEELVKMLMAEKPSIALYSLHTLGLLKYIIPELEALVISKETLPYHKPESSFAHTLRVLDNIPARLELRLAALLHDIGKPIVRTVERKRAHFFGHEKVGQDMVEPILTKLKFSKDIIQKVKMLVGLHMRHYSYQADWSDKIIRKFLLEVGELLADVILLAEADIKGSSPNGREKRNIKHLQEFKNRLYKVESTSCMTTIIKPILNGHELMQLFSIDSKKDGLSWIGKVHTYLRDVQLEFPDISKEKAKELVFAYIQNNFPHILRR